MARKDPYKIVKISERIYAELQKRRESDSREEYKIPAMNGFIERVLWDYAQGKLFRKERAEASSLPTLEALFEVDPKALTEEQVQMVLELGRRVQQKFDFEEDQSRIRKKKSA